MTSIKNVLVHEKKNCTVLSNYSNGLEQKSRAELFLKEFHVLKTSSHLGRTLFHGERAPRLLPYSRLQMK